nr:immunoglobulin heavy chain junction region [Macaca mulatta]MOV40702.1 immunoglobulin heavy chain junction region [Macaca mulatta]MOV41520.1 immunoglobulin heavy chain junction region [Macaca mulatta]MOV42542.1 immunoglobulin heavy chain junction region [Macaca mulatta]MOV44293.1 immunoglobulin heavy chain junction region [Macaca mulatta]
CARVSVEADSSFDYW